MLVEDNLRKQESDKDMDEELKGMVETYRQQGTQIMEMKALLMRYLMKSGTVDTTAQKSKRWAGNSFHLYLHVDFLFQSIIDLTVTTILVTNETFKCFQ
jgi:hypothetical protein